MLRLDDRGLRARVWAVVRVLWWCIRIHQGKKLSLRGGGLTYWAWLLLFKLLRIENRLYNLICWCGPLKRTSPSNLYSPHLVRHIIYHSSPLIFLLSLLIKFLSRKLSFTFKYLQKELKSKCLLDTFSKEKWLKKERKVMLLHNW